MHKNKIAIYLKKIVSPLYRAKLMKLFTVHTTILLQTIFQVPWSQSANILLLALSMCSILGLVQADPDIGKGSYGGEPSHLDVDDPDFSGVVDFSNAIPGTVQDF